MERQKEAATKMVAATLRLASELKVVRQELGEDDFKAWLDETKTDLDDLLAFIGTAESLDPATGRSLRDIWRNEIEPLLKKAK